jgi:isocitrate lyase
MTSRQEQAQQLQQQWETDPRWKGIKRSYSADDVVRLRGSLPVEHTLAKRGAEKLWESVNNEPFVNSLGALTGNQAMQQVKAGLKAIYLSGWQVAGDANVAGEMYPDQSLYPANSVPLVVKRINNTLTRADQIQWSEGKNPGDEGYIDYFAPIVADAEAGFDEGDDRIWRRGRALRRPARFREEVRPHGRQGARADPRKHRQADRCASGG